MARADDQPMPADPPRDWVYAGFWIRVWASLIDSALLLIVLFPLLAWLIPQASGPAVHTGRLITPDGRIDYQALSIGGPALPGPLHVLVYWILPALVVIVFWLAREATPGKMAIHARIVDARTGEKPSAGRLVLRYLGYYPSTIVFGLGLIWVGIDRRKQGWHDKLAGTVVVRPRRIVEATAEFPGAASQSRWKNES